MSTSGDRGAGGGPTDRPGDAAIAVETTVSEERGRWVVHVAVVFTDGAVRHRISDHPTRRRAEIAASWIQRTASRDIDGPWLG